MLSPFVIFTGIVAFLYLFSSQDALINPVVVAPLKAVIGDKQTPWRAHVEGVAPNVGHRIVPTSSAPVKAVPTNRGKSASVKFSNETSRALIDAVTVTPPHKVLPATFIPPQHFNLALLTT